MKIGPKSIILPNSRAVKNTCPHNSLSTQPDAQICYLFRGSLDILAPEPSPLAGRYSAIWIQTGDLSQMIKKLFFRVAIGSLLIVTTAQTWALAEKINDTERKSSQEEDVIKSGKFNVFVYKTTRLNNTEGKSWIVVDGLKYVPVGRGVLGAFHLSPGPHQLQVRPFFDDHAHLNFDISVRDGENLYFELITDKLRLVSLDPGPNNVRVLHQQKVLLLPTQKQEAVPAILACCKYRPAEDI